MSPEIKIRQSQKNKETALFIALIKKNKLIHLINLLYSENPEVELT